MDTNSKIRGAAAAVTGARHLRVARNGQDAAAAWTGVRSDGVRSDGVRSDGVRSDGVRSDGVRSDGVRPDGVRSDGVRSDGVQPDGVRSDGVRPCGVRSDGVRSDGVRPCGVRSDGVRSDGVRPCGVRSDGVRSDGVRSDGVRPCGVRSGGVRSDGVRSDGVRPCGVRSDGVRSDGVRSDGVRPCGVRSDGVRSDGVQPDGVRVGAIVVCDGCGSGASSEVGARLGAQLVIAALAPRLVAGARPADPAMWAAVRAEVGAALARLVDAMPGDREAIVHEHFLFTIVAAAVAGDEVGVWAIGDGAYAISGTGRAAAQPRVLGPFADNRPPYLAYDLLDFTAPAHLETARLRAGTVVVATDGVAELGLEALTGDAGIARYLCHPDALRRQLALLARSAERVDWAERRTVRTPAALQDDGAVAILRWSVEEPS